MPKNGNITGQVFDKDVIDQIETRQSFLGERNRTDKHILYANNNSAFLRLASSVNVGYKSKDFEKELIQNSLEGNLSIEENINLQSQLDAGSNQLKARGINENLTGMNLAKACVLFGGIVGIDDSLTPTRKFGIVDNEGSDKYDYISTIAAYGWGGISSKGFVPMPSIESASISFYNRGALQKADVKIKVYSLEQLQIFDLLYFRIGYTMLLEWGHNMWIENNTQNLKPRDKFATEPFQLFFSDNPSQQELIQAIQKQRKDDNYNYDAMLGKVTNFTWKFNDDLTYDIDLKLVGLGDIIESLKINTAAIISQKELSPTALLEKRKKNLNAALTTRQNTAPANNSGTARTNLSTALQAANTARSTLTQAFITQVATIIGFREKTTGDNYVSAEKYITSVGTLTENSDFNEIERNIAKITTGLNLLTNEGDTRYETERQSISSANSTFYQKIRDVKAKITALRTAERLDADLAEQLRREIANLQRAIQQADADAEKLQISPQTSAENKNRTKLNTQLFEWSQQADNLKSTALDKDGNLFNFKLQANSTVQQGNLSINFRYVRLGYLLDWMQSNLLYYDSTKTPPAPAPGENFIPPGNPIFKIDVNPDFNFCLRFPTQFSSDPRVCVIPSAYTNTITKEDGTNEEIKWNVFPALNKYLVENNPFVGKIMNLFVNIDHVASVLDKNTDLNGKTSLHKFLSQLFYNINDALGNVNKLEPVFDSEENTLKILEQSNLESIRDNFLDIESKTTKTATFQSYGIGTAAKPEGTFLTNIDFSVQLPPNMAAMATISAQAGGNVVGENATGLSKLNVGLSDRLVTLKLDKDSIEGAQTGKLDPEKIFLANLQTVSKVINSLYGVGTTEGVFNVDTVENIRSVNRDLALYLTGNEALNGNMPPPFFIPFNLSLDMEGLSGMRNYERFAITENILPYSYRPQKLNDEGTFEGGVLDFLIKGITHSISGNKWTTKIESISVSSKRVLKT